MTEFLKSNIAQIIARNGILAVILAWALYANHGMTERLFVVIENNTRAFVELKNSLDGRLGHGRE